MENRVLFSIFICLDYQPLLLGLEYVGISNIPIANTAIEIHRTISNHSFCLKKEILITNASAAKTTRILPIFCLDKGSFTPF